VGKGAEDRRAPASSEKEGMRVQQIREHARIVSLARRDALKIIAVFRTMLSIDWVQPGA
jgi:hypothetical protein